MIKIYDQKNVNIRWEVYKAVNNVHEDFSQAEVWMFLIADEHKYPLHTALDGNFVTATIDGGAFAPGSYSAVLMWLKNPETSKDLTRTELDNIFALTPYEDEDTSRVEGDVTVTLKSMVATYGYDGLDAYERAIMLGRFWGSEEEWMLSLGDHDLANYYTKGEVDELIDNVEVDLTDYYTKGQTDAKINEAAGGLRQAVQTNTDDIEAAKTDITEMGRTVSDHTTAIGQNTEDIGNATERILANEGNISSLQGSMTSMGGRVSTLETKVDNFVGLNQSNYKGMFSDVNSLPSMTEIGWAWVGTDMAAMAVYVWFNSTDGWTRYGSNTYDLTDYSGVASQLATIGLKLGDLESEVIYDVSANNDGATFASLSALLSDANLSTLIPITVRSGGMSIRFIQTSDNKYVQYRLMSDTFNTTDTNWQGVDNEPTANSDNLVKSGGIFSGIQNSLQLAYVECNTPAETAAKTIMLAGYILPTNGGGSIKVKMTNANTANDATLNINSTGAKALFYDGKRVSVNNSWEAGETVEVYYDGTSFYANNVAGGSGSGDGAFDISAAHSGATYDNLAAALGTNGANVPASKRKGGMSVKYINTSTEKYVYYNYNDTNGDFDDVNSWQQVGVNTYIKSLLQTILRSAVYTSDMNSLIEELGNVLGALDNGEPSLKPIPPVITIVDSNINIIGTNEIYYTIDGRTPDKNSNRYTGPFTIQYDSIVKAVAYDGDVASVVTVLEYSAEPVEYISFEDTAVLEPLVISRWDMDNDGKLTPGEAAAVSDSIWAHNKSPFRGTAITSFEELAFFEGLTTIGFQAFSGCSSLKTIRVPKNVTKIDSQAFQGCTDLEMIYLPDGITTMCNCFGGSSGAVNAKLKIAGKKLPSSLNSFMGLQANDLTFRGCAELELDELPPHFPKISSYAFYGCSKLALTSLPNEITSIGTNAFRECRKLAITEIPASVSGTIGPNTFKSCTSLVSLNIKGSITKIEGAAFDGCTNLEEIIFPETMTTWGEMFTFHSCDKLTKIVLKSPTVVTLDRANNDTIGKNSVIYVPANLVNSYLADAKWSTIPNAANRIVAITQ